MRVFAKSDFKHDFGENVPSRDLITKSDRKRFSEMVQRFPVKKRVSLLNKFDAEFPEKKENKKNLFEMYGDTIAEQLYPDPPGDSSEYTAEVDILSAMGVDYLDLKNRVKAHFSANTDPIPPSDETRLPVNAGGLFTRNYAMGAQLYKEEDGSTRNLASLFKDVTGGATNFAILVDASLGMSVTSIGDSSLTPDPGAPCKFVVLQNIESDADSATGANSFKLTPGTNSTTVEIMRDITTSTSLYPIWNKDPETTKDTENLFSKIQIILNRVKADDIEASIILGDESHTIPDVGTTSNVKNASLNALVAQFNNELKGAAVTPADTRTPYLYALLKRMGDWCQALSLLDRIRVYTPLDPKTKQPTGGAPMTIQELIEKGFEVGLVTNDRILLAYGLLLGVNVYFTTASDLNCLLYFKNIDDVVVQDVKILAENNYQTFLERIGTIREGLNVQSETLEGALTGVIEACETYYAFVIPGTPLHDEFRGALLNKIGENLTNGGVPDNALLEGIARAFEVKVALSNIGELRTNFRELANEIVKNGTIFNSDTTTEKQKFDASVNLVNIVNRIKTDFDYNDEVLTRLKSGKLSGTFESNQNVFIDLALKMEPGGRIPKSNSITSAKNLLLTCHDDIEQILQKGIMTPEQLALYIPTAPVEALPIANSRPRPNSRDIENFTALYDAFKAVVSGVSTGNRGQSGGKQKGGDDSPFAPFFQREVFPYHTPKLETTINTLVNQLIGEKPGGENALAAINLLESLPVAQVGSYYRTEKNHPYSVIDRYILTKEELGGLAEYYAIFLNQGNGVDEAGNVIPRLPTAEELFFQWRLALLYHDILYQRLERIEDHAFNAAIPRVNSAFELEDIENTEEANAEVYSTAWEVALLRVFVNRAANAKPAAPIHIEFANHFINYILGSGITAREFLEDMDKLAGFKESLVERMMYVRIAETQYTTKQSQDKFRAELRTNLASVRDVIFNNYSPMVVDAYIPSPSETSDIDVNIESNIVETVLVSEGMDLADDVQGAPAQDGGSRLKHGPKGISNASSSSSSPPRRRLYEGLRKRSRAVRTYRVRQRTGKSHTRRQRLPVGSL